MENCEAAKCVIAVYLSMEIAQFSKSTIIL